MKNREEIILQALKFRARAYDDKSTPNEKKRAIDKYNNLVFCNNITEKEILKMKELLDSPSFSCFGEKFKSIADFKVWFMKLKWWDMLGKSLMLLLKIEKIKKTTECQ